MTAAPVAQPAVFQTVATRLDPQPHGLCRDCADFDPVFEGGRAGVCRSAASAKSGWSVGRMSGCADRRPRAQTTKRQAK